MSADTSVPVILANGRSLACVFIQKWLVSNSEPGVPHAAQLGRDANLRVADDVGLDVSGYVAIMRAMEAS